MDGCADRTDAHGFRSGCRIWQSLTANSESTHTIKHEYSLTYSFLENFGSTKLGSDALITGPGKEGRGEREEAF